MYSDFQFSGLDIAKIARHHQTLITSLNPPPRFFSSGHLTAVRHNSARAATSNIVVVENQVVCSRLAIT